MITNVRKAVIPRRDVDVLRHRKAHNAFSVAVRSQRLNPADPIRSLLIDNRVADSLLASTSHAARSEFIRRTVVRSPRRNNRIYEARLISRNRKLLGGNAVGRTTA